VCGYSEAYVKLATDGYIYLMNKIDKGFITKQYVYSGAKYIEHLMMRSLLFKLLSMRTKIL